MALLDELTAYTPFCPQEVQDREILCDWLKSSQDVFGRANPGHFTASAWVLSPDRQQVLMVYHNIYQSWSWMGGHADGDTDLCAVARREAQEESGLESLKLLQDGIFSLELLTVDGHVKRGQYVSSHLHGNITYLFEADPSAAVRSKPDENSGVSWIPLAQLTQKVSEPWMLRHVYTKLCQKAAVLGF